VEKQYDLTNSIREFSQESCYSDSDSVPEVWTHATPEEMGYFAQDNGTYRGYKFRAGVVNIDSPRIKNGDLKSFILSHKGSTDDYVSYDKGFKEHISRYEMSVDSYNIVSPSPKTPVTDVCPAQWSRFSCQFVRLCASPSVVGKYDLASSEEFKYAHCKADNRSVPEVDTHFSPYDVGYAALLVDRVYFKAVKLDSPNIFEGDIEEAIERLVLIPIQPHALMDYDRGYEVGRTRFERSVSKANQKQQQSEGGQSPH
jgi:hypothetical protein